MGGPIVAEQGVLLRQRRLGAQGQPVRLSRSAGSGQQFGRQAEVAALHRHPAAPDTATTRAATDEFIRTINSDKFFVRADFNLGQRNQLTVRHNYMKAQNDIGRPTIVDLLHAGQLLPIQGQDELDGRPVEQHARHGGQRAALHVSARFATSAPGSRTRIGRSRSSRSTLSSGHAFARDARTSRPPTSWIRTSIELTDDFTLLRGKHTFTFGTHNEFFKFRNLFIRDNFGNYTFASLDCSSRGSRSRSTTASR